MWNQTYGMNRLIPANEEDKKFATEVLKYKWRAGTNRHNG